MSLSAQTLCSCMQGHAHPSSPAQQTSFDSDASLLRLSNPDVPSLPRDHVRSTYSAGETPLPARLPRPSTPAGGVWHDRGVQVGNCQQQQQQLLACSATVSSALDTCVALFVACNPCAGWPGLTCSPMLTHAEPIRMSAYCSSGGSAATCISSPSSMDSVPMPAHQHPPQQHSAAAADLTSLTPYEVGPLLLHCGSHAPI